MTSRTVCGVLGLLGAALTSEGRPAPMPVGGQAVIEGVMMKGYTRWGMAVRDGAGKLVREHWPLKPVKLGGAEKWPVLRGFLVMVEMLVAGFHGLSRSTEISLGEEEDLTTKDLILTGVLAFAAVAGLFVVLPMILGKLSARWLGLPVWGANVLEGLFRGGVFIAYLGLLGAWKDMARVLAYHGAEHKTINAYEGGLPMDVSTIGRCSRIHPRCGTSFLMVVVVVSIVVFSLVGQGGFLWRTGMRILLIPAVVGLSFEIIRWSTRSAVGACVMKPALSLQYLTTREPDASQIEAGRAALEEALGRTFAPDERNC